MTRLTNKRLADANKNGYFIEIKKEENVKCHSVEQLYEKLARYEDIEEELGIDLITLFEALKYGIYKKGRNNLKGLILYSKMPMLSFYHKTIDAELIEDYGKTWALTREELKK